MTFAFCMEDSAVALRALAAPLSAPQAAGWRHIDDAAAMSHALALRLFIIRLALLGCASTQDASGKAVWIATGLRPSQ
jgi:hypothetical protein